MTDPITTPAEMREAAALLPCPFCGGSNAHISPVKRGDKHRMYPLVRCMDCYLDLPGQNGDYSTDGRTAIAAWNRRALPVAKPERPAEGLLRGAREALAMVQAEPAPVAVRVKPLVWQMEDGRQDDCPKWIADVDAKRYEVFKAWWGDQDKWGFVALGEFYHTEDAAKAAAEADHAVRVLSQIEALPAAQVRAEALREAARECDKLAGDPRMYGAERRRAAGQCAATIRAMIEKEPNE